MDYRHTECTGSEAAAWNNRPRGWAGTNYHCDKSYQNLPGGSWS